MGACAEGADEDTSRANLLACCCVLQILSTKSTFRDVQDTLNRVSNRAVLVTPLQEVQADLGMCLVAPGACVGVVLLLWLAVDFSQVFVTACLLFLWVLLVAAAAAAGAW